MWTVTASGTLTGEIPNTELYSCCTDWGGSAERWSDVMPTFSKYYRVVAPDLLGFGFSDKPQINYTPESLSFFVDSFIRTVCNQRIFLMGSSLGGQIATLYAASHPASIGKLVLVAPSGTTYKTTPAFNTYVTAAMYPSEQTAARAFEEMDASGEPVADETINSFVKRMKTKKRKDGIHVGRTGPQKRSHYRIYA